MRHDALCERSDPDDVCGCRERLSRCPAKYEADIRADLTHTCKLPNGHAGEHECPTCGCYWAGPKVIHGKKEKVMNESSLDAARRRLEGQLEEEEPNARCGAVHPLVEEAVCPLAKGHDGDHGFLLRWG